MPKSSASWSNVAILLHGQQFGHCGVLSESWVIGYHRGGSRGAALRRHPWCASSSSTDCGTGA